MQPPKAAPGTALPDLDIPITTTLIVGGAIASRDFYPGHHDARIARERGSADVFLNVMTTSGLVGRYLTDWAGPRAVIRSLAVKLGAPGYPGDVLALRGEVTEVTADDVGQLLTIRVTGSNRLGDHVRATAKLFLPATEPPRD
ncbi:acyl dehydratase [Mycobacterium paraffinicum]|uniref:Acyl dehydratase n=1 Tax=Mycobacterium paraffinicum TaxID=53378 RepID=A0A1Q4I3C1_9MYCO|nr:acyl dehydratase [Mycobacterium paraffinicum]